MSISNGIREQLTGEMICDFCSSRDLFYAYFAADFIPAEVVVPTAGSFALNSLGAWLACRECTDLIEGERWEELLDRSLRTFREIHGAELGMTEEDEPRIRELLRQIHAGSRLFEEEELGLVQVEENDPCREQEGRLCPITAIFQIEPAN